MPNQPLPMRLPDPSAQPCVPLRWHLCTEQVLVEGNGVNRALGVANTWGFSLYFLNKIELSDTARKPLRNTHQV